MLANIQSVVLGVAVVIVKLPICISAAVRSIHLFNFRFFIILSDWSVLCSCFLRLDHQPLFGKGARAPPTRHERAAEIEPTVLSHEQSNADESIVEKL